MGRKKIIVKDDSNKKDDLDPSKDEFVVKSMSYLDWAVERRKQIGLLLGIGLAVWIGIIVFNHITETKIQEASKVLADGLEASIAPIVDDAEVTGADGDKLTYTSTEERAKEAASRLNKAIKSTAGTPVASAAKLAKASVLVEKGEHDAAISLYKECLQDKTLDVFKESILAALALALETKGADEEAQKVYQQLLESSTGRIAMWARLGIASILHRKGNELDKAETMLKSIVEEVLSASEPSRNDYLLVKARTKLMEINPDADVPELPQKFDPMLLQQLMQAQQAGGAAQ